MTAIKLKSHIVSPLRPGAKSFDFARMARLIGAPEAASTERVIPNVGDRLPVPPEFEHQIESAAFVARADDPAIAIESLLQPDKASGQRLSILSRSKGTDRTGDFTGPWLTEKEAAAYLNYSPATLRNWRVNWNETRRGPPFSKPDEVRSVRYNINDIDAWAKKNMKR